MTIPLPSPLAYDDLLQLAADAKRRTLTLEEAYQLGEGIEILASDLDRARGELARLKRRIDAPRPGFDETIDITQVSTGFVITYLSMLCGQRDKADSPIVQQALDLRIGEVEREIALRNARQVAALDAQSGARVKP